MPTILNGFVTSAGVKWAKKQDSSGRTYYHKEGSGRVNRQQFAAANRHFEYPLRVEGDLPPEMLDASVSELEEMTNIPFSQDFYKAIAGSPETKREYELAEGSRWLGFKEALRDQRPGISDEDAAREYLRFGQELRQAETAQERAIVKDRYNIGGS